MAKMNDENKQAILQYLEIHEASENLEDIIDLIKKISHIMPLNQKNKIELLENIIIYINAIINGDPIQQVIQYEYETHLAKHAISEFAAAVHEERIEAFHKGKEELEESIEELGQKESELTRKIGQLSEKHTTLKAKVADIKNELAAITEDLEDKKAHGLEQVEKEIQIKRKKLEDENKQLQELQKKLQAIVDELRQQMDNYNQQIANLDAQKVTVMWTKINSDDSIYNTNYRSIDDYIHSLKLIYQEKTGCTWDQTELAFKKNCPELTALANLIKSFNNKETPSTASLRIIIKTPNWDAQGKHKVAAIIALLGTLKLPIYGETKQLPSTTRIATIPENMNILLRELQLQKITLEAMAKKQIAEANLLAVINLLAKFIPSDIDLNELLLQYNIVPSELHGISDHESIQKIK